MKFCISCHPFLMVIRLFGISKVCRTVPLCSTVGGPLYWEQKSSTVTAELGSGTGKSGKGWHWRAFQGHMVRHAEPILPLPSWTVLLGVCQSPLISYCQFILQAGPLAQILQLAVGKVSRDPSGWRPKCSVVPSVLEATLTWSGSTTLLALPVLQQHFFFPFFLET